VSGVDPLMPSSRGPLLGKARRSIWWT
jgi:hypothetical protein